DRALRRDLRGLGAGHARRAQQHPQAALTGQRTDLAFDAGGQAEALTGEAEAARHGGGPREVWSPDYTPGRRFGKAKLSPHAVDNSVDGAGDSRLRRRHPRPPAACAVTDQLPRDRRRHSLDGFAAGLARVFTSLIFGSLSFSSSSMPISAMLRRRSTTRALTLPSGKRPLSSGAPAGSPSSRPSASSTWRTA